MSIDKAHRILSNGLANASSEHEWCEAFKTALDTIQKYQKIEDIYYHQSGEALENSLRAVIEDGND